MNSSIQFDHKSMERSLQALLGHHAAACCCSTEGDVTALTPDEFSSISGAIALRQKEFAAGRSAARHAMHRIGHPGAPLTANKDRSPRWPPELVGSISHCRTTCVAVVALREHWHSVGVDLEHDRNMPRELWDSICRTEELQRVAELPEAARGRWVTRIFCAKEAYYKWIYPQILTMMDFQDVTIELRPNLDSTRFAVHPLTQDAIEATPAGLMGTLTSTQDKIIGLMIH